MIATDAGISIATTPLSKNALCPIYVSVLPGAKVTSARLPMLENAPLLIERMPAGISMEVNAVDEKAQAEIFVSPAPILAERMLRLNENTQSPM